MANSKLVCLGGLIIVMGPIAKENNLVISRRVHFHKFAQHFV